MNSFNRGGEFLKTKVEKSLKEKSTPVKKVSSEPSLSVKVDETYQQVNQLAFQQNLKTLIGHYKTNDVLLA